MQESVICHHEDFLELCDHIQQAGIVAFDTEFTSDAGYRYELGLLQFATPERCVAVDPLAFPELGRWWQIMADDSTTVVVHGGQAEVRFCLQQCGLKPQKLVDIQLAEGLRCRSYPLSYSAIVERILGKHVESSQTRTDWQRRPLSAEQIHYALEDVSNILPIWDAQRRWLERRGRLDWAFAEFDRMVEQLAADERTPPWQRVTGIHKLHRRELAIAQKLAKWREEEAAFRNRPPRRILRDDLLIDLARRKPTTVQAALATRDLNRPEIRKRIDEMLEAIREGLEVPEDQLPRRFRSRSSDISSDEQVIAKLLGLALANRCAQLNIAQSFVGTNQDLVEVVRFIRNGDQSARPLLLEGWREQVCGELLLKVLRGEMSFRVAPAGSGTPLLFEDVTEADAEFPDGDETD
ncbi:MAG: HRDC domain-containing protein [Planctomycetaceae bacterium]|nr:HRDC domain-containing protein [Planctomycetaceae bacterium]